MKIKYFQEFVTVSSEMSIEKELFHHWWKKQKKNVTFRDLKKNYLM